MKIRTVSVTGDIKTWRGRAVNGGRRGPIRKIVAGERVRCSPATHKRSGLRATPLWQDAGFRSPYLLNSETLAAATANGLAVLRRLCEDLTNTLRIMSVCLFFFQLVQMHMRLGGDALVISFLVSNMYVELTPNVYPDTHLWLNAMWIHFWCR